MGVKQQIPSSTNAPKSMQFAKLRGLDCSTSPFEVSPTRAVNMRNIINDDGINHKRQGWTENTTFLKNVARFSQNGVLVNAYDLGNDNLLLAFTDVFTIVNKNGDETHKFNYPIPNVSKVKFVKIDNRKLLIFYQDAEGNENSLTFETYAKIILQEEKYVPTTTISINPDSEKDATRESFEEPSLVSNKRKNKLLGNKAMQLTIKYDGETDDRLGDIKITSQDGKSLIGSFTYSKVTAVLLKGTYNLDIKDFYGSNRVIYIKKTVEKTNETTGIIKEEVVEEVITSINLIEDTTIYVKEA